MKKTKLIIIGVVLSLLLVGGAYAAWASQIELTMNASAGELDVEISKVSVSGVSDYVKFDKESVEISEDKKSASVTIENLYPGASANAAFEISNCGTLPVALDKVMHKLIEVIDTKTNEKRPSSDMAALKMEYRCSVINEDGKVIESIGKANVNGKSESATLFRNNKAIIKPGEKVLLEMTISMKNSAKDEAENKLFKFSVTPFFTQGA